MRLTLVEVNWVKHVLRAEAEALEEQPLPRGHGDRRLTRNRQVRLYRDLAAALERRELIEFVLE